MNFEKNFAKIQNQVENLEKTKNQEKQEKQENKKFPSRDDYIKEMEELNMPKCALAYKKVCELCEVFKEKGGEALLVGGSVRDFYMGKIPKDFDLEIYGLESEIVEEIVKGFGKASDVGRSFGIMKVFLENGIDIDVSIPRLDSKNGEGHKGFDVKVDPKMSIQEAALRRDFTMNTLAVNPLTQEIHDYYGGIEDIKNKMLRITDKERFKDDPLRVMRAMQFVGRFGIAVDNKSEEIIKEITSNAKELPKERFLEEWKKLLLKSEKPSLGLIKGMEWGIFREMHPEFPPLLETPQEKEWHPEGDVWMHTLMSVDEAAKLCRIEQYEKKDAFVIMLAALCHDIGKPTTTEIGERITSKGHDKAGEKPTEKFLETIGINKKDAQKIIKLVTNHMAPSLLYVASNSEQGVGDKAIRRLAKRIHPATIQELITVAHADHSGRGSFEKIDFSKQILDPTVYKPREWLNRKSQELGVYNQKPEDLVKGRDLLDQGQEGGIKFGEIISLINEIRDLEDELRSKLNSDANSIEKLSKEEILEIIKNIKDLDDVIKQLVFIGNEIKKQLKFEND